MAVQELFSNGVVVQRFDSNAGTATTYKADGTVASSRSLTPDEQAFLTQMDQTATRSTNLNTIQTKAAAAITANSTYLAIGTPTNAQIAAQVRALTQQNNKIIRVLLGMVLGDRAQLDSTN